MGENKFCPASQEELLMSGCTPEESAKHQILKRGKAAHRDIQKKRT